MVRRMRVFAVANEMGRGGMWVVAAASYALYLGRVVTRDPDGNGETSTIA